MIRFFKLRTGHGPGGDKCVYFVVNILMAFYRNREKRKAEGQNNQDLDMGDGMEGPKEKNTK
jgi:hypothetical protein